MVQTVETGTDKLIAEVEGAVGRIVFNNPERHNAITTDMFAALAAVVDAYEQDAKIRVVVVSGAGGRAFASGADIGNLDSARGPSRNPSPDDARTSRGPAALGRLTKPLIAAVDGYCLGGGLLVALHADLLVATDRSKFGIPAARLGVGYPIEGVEQLVGRVGDANAARILMTGDQVGAEEAASMGLAHKVVPADELDDEVEQLCSRLVANAPLTLRAVKLSIASLRAGGIDRQPWTPSPTAGPARILPRAGLPFPSTANPVFGGADHRISLYKYVFGCRLLRLSADHAGAGHPGHHLGLDGQADPPLIPSPHYRHPRLGHGGRPCAAGESRHLHNAECGPRLAGTARRIGSHRTAGGRLRAFRRVPRSQPGSPARGTILVGALAGGRLHFQAHPPGNPAVDHRRAPPLLEESVRAPLLCGVRRGQPDAHGRGTGAPAFQPPNGAIEELSLPSPCCATAGRPSEGLPPPGTTKASTPLPGHD